MAPRKDKSKPPQVQFRVYCHPMGRWTKALASGKDLYCYACGKILTLSHKEDEDYDDITIN